MRTYLQRTSRRSFAAPTAVAWASLLLAFVGCSDGGEKSSLDAADHLSDHTDPLDSSHSNTGPQCVAQGQDCSHSDCCKGSCQESVCVSADTPSCAATGESCATRECCAGTCSQRTCLAAGAPAQCAALGQSCSTQDCCGGVCEASVCVEQASCVPRGGDCSARDCCEGSCAASVCH